MMRQRLWASFAILLIFPVSAVAAEAVREKKPTAVEVHFDVPSIDFKSSTEFGVGNPVSTPQAPNLAVEAKVPAVEFGIIKAPTDTK
jgi:hypothetical protein